MAGILDFKVPQGETFVRNIEVNEDDGETSQDMDLTGFSIEMQVREKFESNDPTLTASTDNDKITITTPATQGKISIEFTAAETAALRPRKYVYDIEYTAPSGAVVRMLQGDFIVSAQVTR
jgi:hypothetical protein